MITGSSIFVVLILTALCTTVSILILMKNGWVISAKRIRFFGFDFDAVHFQNLSAVVRYINVSRSLARAEELDSKNSLSKIDPFTLIYIGWALIADAYLERFHEAPDERSLNERAKEIGNQNAEYIGVFQGFYIAACKMQDTQKIQLDLAVEYFDKSSGLTERIMNSSDARSRIPKAIKRKLLDAGFDEDFSRLEVMD